MITLLLNPVLTLVIAILVAVTDNPNHSSNTYNPYLYFLSLNDIV